MVEGLDSFPSEFSKDTRPSGSFKDTLIPTKIVSLAELQSSGVPIEWYEAIAIIQNLCRAILESGDEVGPAALRAGQVFVDSSGNVSSNGSGPKDARTCVQRLGELLRETLPEGQFPTPLRLVVSQAIFTPPLYSSIKEFSRALEHFERPNRTAIIQAVYERWKTTPAPSAAAAAVQATQQEEIRVPITASHAHRGRTRTMAVVVAALIFGALAGVGAWVFGLRTSVASSASNTVRNVGDTALKTATSAVDAILDRFLSVLVERPAVPPDSATTAAPPVPRRSTRTAPAALPSENVSIFDLETSGVWSSSVPAPPSASQPSVDGPGAATPAAAQDRNETAINPITYTASDDDVVPPVAIYPQFPTELPEGVRMTDLVIIEVLVTETGNVGFVKVREAPKTLAGTMVATQNLSAAKTWRFRPALKDGQPVKYRKTVWVLTH